MRIANGVEMLELEAEGFGGRSVLNPTLVWDDGMAVLIDTGMPDQLADIKSAMHDTGVPFEKIKAVILTHQDFDHIGCIEEVIRNSDGQIKVYAHELDKPYVEGVLPQIKTTPAAMAKVLESLPEEQRQAALALFGNPPKAKVDVTLADGEELPICGGIKVIHTPGHTEGHISLYLMESKTLVAADAMICVNGNLHGPVQQTTLDMDAAVKSLEKFLDLEIDNVICYHGGVCTDNPKAQIRSIIEKAKIVE